MAAFDIIVAGAGPAGAAAARTLAQCAPQLRVGVIAPESQRDAQARGEVLSPLVQPVLRQLGLWPAFLRQDFAPSHRTLVSWEEPGLMSSEWLLMARGPSWRVARAEFDAWIMAEAGRDAARIDAKVAGIARDGDGWSLACDDGSRHEARLVIDATGRSRALADRLGACAKTRDRLVAAYAEAAMDGAAAPELLVEACEDGWWYTLALGDGRRAFACMTDADIAHDLGLNRPDGWRAALARTQFVAAIAGRIATLERPRLMTAGTRSAATTTGFRFLCAGDAASAFDPISGHGVVKAMRAGVFAAYAASDCLLRGDAAALDRYGAFVAQEAEAYATTLSEHYASVSRWADHPFWQRRRAALS